MVGISGDCLPCLVMPRPRFHCGLRWQDAERLAFADVADERRAAGDTELLWIPHRDEPIAEDFDNTIGWDEMRRCLHGEVLPPRPGDGIPDTA